jgi:hypothetical protein
MLALYIFQFDWSSHSLDFYSQEYNDMEYDSSQPRRNLKIKNYIFILFLYNYAVYTTSLRVMYTTLAAKTKVDACKVGNIQYKYTAQTSFIKDLFLFSVILISF